VNEDKELKAEFQSKKHHHALKLLKTFISNLVLSA